jgi:galactokinase
MALSDIVPSSTMAVTHDLIEQCLLQLKTPPTAKARVFFSPGRANLLGAHLDYNGGCVMPVALSRGTCGIFEPRSDQRLCLRSSNFPGQIVELNIAELRPGRTQGWSAYLEGALFVAHRQWGGMPGLNITLSADLPMAKGLSSSASVETLAIFALAHLLEVETSADEMIRLAHSAETDYVGVRCGILDQTAIMLAKPDSLLLFDCLELTREHLPLGAEQAVIAIVDSGTARELASSAFNQRVAECTQALAFFQKEIPGITCLRDVRRSAFEDFADRLSAVLRRRVEHVVGEVERIEAGAAALRKGDLGGFGRAISGAHESMRDLYEVSTPELDALVEAALEVPGCYGSRLTGAGFGGCIVALVAPEAMEEFSDHVPARYFAATGRQTEVLAFRPSGGPVEWAMPTA